MRGGIMKPGRATGPSEFEGNIDPHCGVELKERDPQRSTQLEGRILFFCSRECKRAFDANATAWSERLKESGLARA